MLNINLTRSKQFLATAITCSTFLFGNLAYGALIDRGNGLIYDSTQDIG